MKKIFDPQTVVKFLCFGFQGSFALITLRWGRKVGFPHLTLIVLYVYTLSSY